MPKTKIKKKSEFEKGFDAGYNKGYKEGGRNGYEFASVLMIYALKDYLKVADDRIKEIHKGIDMYVDLVRRGFLNFQMVKKSVHDVFGWTFNWVEDE